MIFSFLFEFLEKWNCYCILERCRFWRGDYDFFFGYVKFLKVIRYLSGGDELGFYVWRIGEKRFELEEKFGSY